MKSSCSTKVICVISSRVNFSSNSRLLRPSDEMDRAWPTPQQHWSSMVSKVKKDNRKKIVEDVGVTKITQELVELRRKVWVLM